MQVIPSYGEVDGIGFKGGLREAYEMTKQLQDDIKVFEKSRTYKVELKELIKEKK